MAATSLDDLKRDDKKMEEICGSHTWRNRYDHFLHLVRISEAGKDIRQTMRNMSFIRVRDTAISVM